MSYSICWSRVIFVWFHRKNTGTQILFIVFALGCFRFFSFAGFSRLGITGTRLNVRDMAQKFYCMNSHDFVHYLHVWWKPEYILC